MTSEAALGIFIIFAFLAILALILLISCFWVWMIVDCAKREFEKPDEKTVWILVIVLVGVIGAIVYFFAVKSNKNYNGRLRK